MPDIPILCQIFRDLNILLYVRLYNKVLRDLNFYYMSDDITHSWDLDLFTICRLHNGSVEIYIFLLYFRLYNGFFGV